MKKRFVFILKLSLVLMTVGTYMLCLPFDNLRLDKTCYVENQGTYFKTSEPILLRDDLGCDNLIQTIRVEGNIDIIAFTRENGFTYQGDGVVEAYGFVPCMFINKEQDAVQGSIHIFQKNGVQKDFDVIQEGENIVIFSMK